MNMPTVKFWQKLILVMLCIIAATVVLFIHERSVYHAYAKLPLFERNILPKIMQERKQAGLPPTDPAPPRFSESNLERFPDSLRLPACRSHTEGWALLYKDDTEPEYNYGYAWKYKNQVRRQWYYRRYNIWLDYKSHKYLAFFADAFRLCALPDSKLLRRGGLLPIGWSVNKEVIMRRFRHERSHLERDHTIKRADQ